MTSAYLIPTDYEQPKPVDGKYTAVVYEKHAEFEFHGFKVLARIHGGMNANGNNGFVTVKGDEVDISWEGTASNVDFTDIFTLPKEPSFTDEKELTATLRPSDFDEQHPFSCDEVHGGRAIGTGVKFGANHEYRAFFDGKVQASAFDAPCLVRREQNNPLKCVVEFDDETIFMVKRYGPNCYNHLVEKTVDELQKHIRRQ